ncbi:hypothetical protein VHEMI08766 [[Torrubiella] hemipterigena]|uniref:DUF952 domain protein n=1 Tax=[Torrubiella] hemipterigena TaxID=1531966 RepID=A0A0A1T7R4_9HYPO|nr:hypothetical protein VHEMI08766 [[Torrubiella] hemipterigena]
MTTYITAQIQAMASPDQPNYIYKISPTPPPEPVPAIYPPSELDEKDGFIHLSTAAQVPRTADLFFAEAPHLWFVKIQVERLVPLHRIEWGPTGCVSLYGEVTASDIVAIESYQRDGEKSWAETLMNGKWLE